ncbi:NACHT domain-containing protein [Kineosporia babensis]
MNSAAVLAARDRLVEELTGLQYQRITKLVELIGDDGRIRLDLALEAATRPGALQKRQDAFRQFRHDLAERTGGRLQVEVDGDKGAPTARWCWFEGEDRTVAELGAMSAQGAGRRPDAVTVPAAAVEVLQRPYNVFLSTGGEPGTPLYRDEAALLELLRERFDPEDVRIQWIGDVQLGTELSTDLRDRADLVVCLISASYLQRNHADCLWGSENPHRRMLLAFAQLVAGARLPSELPMAEVHLSAKPFKSRARAQDKESYANDCVPLIRSHLTRLSSPGEPITPAKSRDERFREFSLQRALSRGKHHLVLPEAVQSDFDRAALSATSPTRRLGESEPAVERLVRWALDRTGPAMCALLGDVGIGKTTTTKLLTEELLRRHQTDADIPLPILFDLRDLPQQTLTDEGISLRPILAALLKANDRRGTLPSVDDLLDLVDSGRALLIFDGLDEVIVRMPPADAQRFSRVLWRAAEPTFEAAGPVPAPTRPPRSKLLLSCRTHYFRSIRDEVNHFTGQQRENNRGDSYLVLLMQPFGDEQIREYLANNVPGVDVERMLEVLNEVHNLREIAERPMTLTLIAGQLERIEHAKLTGTTVYGADLYAGFVQDWLERDEGKHSLLPQHKQVLMEHLAATLWRQGLNSWSADQVEQWLLEFLADRPDLRVHYAQPLPDLWKEDLRTATFLVRSDDDTFRFAHTSLREFFLARYLRSALGGPGSPQDRALAWDLPVPSAETLDFLGQMMAGLPDAERSDHHLNSLTAIARSGRAGAACLALAYAMQAQGTLPSPDLSGADFTDAQLKGWKIRSKGGERMDLRGAKFTDADLSDVTFTDLELTGAHFSRADLTRAGFHTCNLDAADFDQSSFVGTVLRRCSVAGIRWEQVHAYRAQDLFCTPPVPTQFEGWRRAPAASGSPTSGLQLLTGHISAVTAVAYHPTGTHLATTSHDQTTRIWDATTGQHLHTLTGHTNTVTAVAYHPTGTHLATTSWDQTTRIWDATTGQHLHTLTGHTNTVTAVAYHPTGTHLATTSNDETIRIWDATTGQHLHTLTGHTDAVTAVAYHPTGTHLATTSNDETIRIWDATTGQHLHTLTGHTSWVTAVAYHPTGTHLATTSWDGTIRIWDATTGQHLHTLTGHTDAVTAVAYHPTGTHLATTSDDGTIRIWDATTGQHLHTLTGHTDAVTAVAYHPTGTHLATTSDDGTIRIWDATTGQHLHTLTGHTSTVTAVAYHPTGTHLATTSNDETIRIWDATTGQHLHTLTGHISTVTAVAYHPTGTHLATTSWDQTTRIWDATTGQHLHTLTGHTDAVTAVAYNPTGTHLATTSWDGTIRIWDATTGQHLHTLADHTDWVRALTYNPIGTHLATTSDDGTIRIWDATTGQHLHTLTGHTSWVTAVAYHPTGTHLATTSDDGTIRIWDATTGQHLHTLTGHTSWVTAVAYHPTGTHLATTSDDGSIRNRNLADQTSLVIQTLNNSEYTVWQEHTEHESPVSVLVHASPGAWQWLGYPTVIDGQIDRLPAESFGPLPTLVDE